jgi:hypothetical protein
MQVGYVICLCCDEYDVAEYSPFLSELLLLPTCSSTWNVCQVTYKCKNETSHFGKEIKSHWGEAVAVMWNYSIPIAFSIPDIITGAWSAWILVLHSGLIWVFPRNVCAENNPTAAVICRTEIKCRYQFFLTAKYVKRISASTTVLINILLMPY